MKKLIIIALLMPFILLAKDYRDNREVKHFINKLVKEYRYSKKSLNTLFANVKVQKVPLRAFTHKDKIKRTPKQIARLKRLYPKYGAWNRYIKHKITPRRINQGVSFLNKHKNILKIAQNMYGVPMEYIVAIIGIESVYGKNVGKYNVFDTLATLSFEPNRRNKFFKNQFLKFMHLAKKERFNPRDVYGSYAGAIGLGQFMPSNYEAYGVDFNRDGRITLQQPADAIASIANYLKKNGWRRGERVATRVKYKGNRFKGYKTGYRKRYNPSTLKGIVLRELWGYRGKVSLIKLNRKSYDELWFGAKNFFVITRYNHSAYYAMAVHQLAQKIKAKSLHKKKKSISSLYEN
ncbi:MAG: lytic murein transglycosylase B [Sulfurovum sp.]